MPETDRLRFSGDPTDHLSYAHGRPPLQGRLRARPENFRVEEILGYPLTGIGEHLVLKVEKCGLNTFDVAQQIARWAGVKPVAVGFAGLKDRNAVTVQHFSVVLSPSETGSLPLLQDSGLRVLDATRHHQKLRRGRLAGNRFALDLTDVVGDSAVAVERLERIRGRGVPNYFGPQRFGNRASNLAGARALLSGQVSNPKPEQRRMWLSAARSHVFNQLLACRVKDDSWDKALSGEVLIATRDGRQLIAPSWSSGLDARIAKAEFNPSGLLPGRAGHCLSPEGEAADREAFCVAAHDVEDWCEALSARGVDADRRALRVMPQKFDWSWKSPCTLSLEFSLPAGSYATAVVRELMSTPLARQ